MKSNPAAPRRRPTPFAFASLLLLLLFLSTTSLLYLLPPPPPGPVLPASYSTSQTVDARLTRYFQSGQWRADARTVVAMFRYLITPEPDTVTNLPPIRA